MERHQDDPNVLVHFTNTLKLGVFPRTKWSDPIGIYFYPLKDMMAKFAEKIIPYGGNFSYAFLVRNDGKMLNLQRVGNTRDYFDTLENAYRDYIFAADDNDDADAVAYYQFCSTRWLERYPRGGEALWELTDRFAAYLAPRMGKDMRMIWRKMFTQLGFDGAIDHGDGIISGNEPSQAVMFNPTFTVLGAAINDLMPLPKERGIRKIY